MSIINPDWSPAKLDKGATAFYSFDPVTNKPKLETICYDSLQAYLRVKARFEGRSRAKSE
jgi:hypothetical protein